MVQRVIFPKKEKDDLMFWAGVDIGISVIFIDNSGVNLAVFSMTNGWKVSFPNWVICIVMARSKSARVEKPIRIIFICLLSGCCLTDAPMKDGRCSPLKISLVRLIISLFVCSGKKFSLAQ